MEFVSKSITLHKREDIEIPLYRLPVGKKAKVMRLLNNGLSRRRLLDLGLIPESIVETERYSPSGNPIAYNIRGSVIALRREETQNVIVKIIDS